MPEEPNYDSMSLEELEAESSKNPAEKPQVDPEPEGDGQQAPEPVAKKHPDTVPYERFNEVYEAKRQADALLQQYHNAAIQAQTRVAPQPQAPAPSRQDIAEYQANMELLSPYLAPLQQQLAAMQNQVVGYEVEKLANKAEQYVRFHVKDFDELAPEMFAEIQSKSQVMQDKILRDPDWVIEIADKVRMKKVLGVQNNQTTVKEDLKKRAVSESRGSGSPTPRQSSSKIDPAYERVILNGTPQELMEFEQKMGKR